MLFSPAFLPGVLTPPAADSGGGEPGGGGQDWPTSNLLWALDPDDASHRTIVSSGGVDYVQRLTAPQNATWYAENTDNPTCPVFETKNGRGVMTFNGTDRALYLTAELISVFGAFNAPHTFHAVRYLPAVHNGFAQGIIGMWRWNGSVSRHTYEFGGDERPNVSCVNGDWTAFGGAAATNDTSAYQRGRPLLFTWRVNTDLSVDFFLDGVKLPNDGGTMPDATISTNGLLGGIGFIRSDGNDGSWLDGSLGALLWYAEAQTDGAIANIAAIKNSRYA